MYFDARVRLQNTNSLFSILWGPKKVGLDFCEALGSTFESPSEWFVPCLVKVFKIKLRYCLVVVALHQPKTADRLKKLLLLFLIEVISDILVNIQKFSCVFFSFHAHSEYIPVQKWPGKFLTSDIKFILHWWPLALFLMDWIDQIDLSDTQCTPLKFARNH